MDALRVALLSGGGRRLVSSPIIWRRMKSKANYRLSSRSRTGWTARLCRRWFFSTANASVMILDIEDEGISSSRRPVRGIPACTHGQGVLSLLYTGRDDAIAAFPNHFSISSSTRSV